MKTNRLFKIKICAFTMAEILLTIFIFGIIMSLLIRTLNRVDPDKDKILFIKSYHLVEEVIANSINDDTKYDQNYYSKKELQDLKAEGIATHLDFADAPLNTAKVRFYSDSEGGSGETVKMKTACPKNSSGETQCDEEITQENAVCYYLAEQLNTIGTVRCNDKSDSYPNFKTSLGVCFWSWWDAGADGTFEAVIDPSCKGKANGYTVKVFKNGSVTVPKTSGTTSNNQAKAYEWMKSPTTVK